MLKPEKETLPSAKASFDHIYDRADPESYFRELQPLDYRAPQSALPIFQSCISALQTLRHKQQLTILDLCCGYGTNAALINHQITLDDLYAHYTDDKRSALPLVQRLAADQDYFKSRKTPLPHRIIGIDVARNALAYARVSGLMAHSYAVNLETSTQPINDSLDQALRSVDLIIVTGGLSYIGAMSFRRLLEKTPKQQRPWIVCFPLRISDFKPLITEFGRFGLRTEQPNGHTLCQRKFHDEAERSRVMTHLCDLQLDPTDKEADGYLHTAFYLARPSTDVVRMPVQFLNR